MPNKIELLKIELEKILIISIGAVPGALIRWKLQNYILANIIGTFVLGFLMGLPFRKKRNLLLGFGFCGALTTFSTWMMKTIERIYYGEYFNAFSQVLLIIIFGLFAVFIGYFSAKKLSSLRLFQ